MSFCIRVKINLYDTTITITGLLSISPKYYSQVGWIHYCAQRELKLSTCNSITTTAHPLKSNALSQRRKMLESVIITDHSCYHGLEFVSYM